MYLISKFLMVAVDVISAAGYSRLFFESSKVCFLRISICEAKVKAIFRTLLLYLMLIKCKK